VRPIKTFAADRDSRNVSGLRAAKIRRKKPESGCQGPRPASSHDSRLAASCPSAAGRCARPAASRPAYRRKPSSAYAGRRQAQRRHRHLVDDDIGLGSTFAVEAGRNYRTYAVLAHVAQGHRLQLFAMNGGRVEARRLGRQRRCGGASAHAHSIRRNRWGNRGVLAVAPSRAGVASLANRSKSKGRPEAA
jgi:hypothetical protein